MVKPLREPLLWKWGSYSVLPSEVSLESNPLSFVFFSLCFLASQLQSSIAGISLLIKQAHPIKILKQVSSTFLLLNSQRSLIMICGHSFTLARSQGMPQWWDVAKAQLHLVPNISGPMDARSSKGDKNNSFTAGLGAKLVMAGWHLLFSLTILPEGWGLIWSGRGKQGQILRKTVNCCNGGGKGI